MRRDHSDTMLFLPYTPRADSESRGYTEWLRRVDNPFFNSVPGIIRYTNWIVLPEQTAKLPFLYFDFLVIKDPAAIERVWGNEALGKFAADWTKAWGVDPEAQDLSVNYHVYLCRRDGAAAPSTSQYVSLALDKSGSSSGTETWHTESWHIVDSILGKATFKNFQLSYRDGPALAQARCLASPD